MKKGTQRNFLQGESIYEVYWHWQAGGAFDRRKNNQANEPCKRLPRDRYLENGGTHSSINSLSVGSIGFFYLQATICHFVGESDRKMSQQLLRDFHRKKLGLLMYLKGRNVNQTQNLFFFFSSQASILQTFKTACCRKRFFRKDVRSMTCLRYIFNHNKLQRLHTIDKSIFWFGPTLCYARLKPGACLKGLARLMVGAFN